MTLTDEYIEQVFLGFHDRITRLNERVEKLEENQRLVDKYKDVYVDANHVQCLGHNHTINPIGNTINETIGKKEKPITEIVKEAQTTVDNMFSRAYDPTHSPFVTIARKYIQDSIKNLKHYSKLLHQYPGDTEHIDRLIARLEAELNK